MMCEQCAELQDRVAWLEEELGLRADADAADLLRLAFLKRTAHLRGNSVGRPQAAQLVAALYRAKGRPVSRWLLLEAIPSPTRKEDRGINTVSVWVTLARKALGADAIANVWGHGYRLTDVGMATVAEILSDRACAA